MPKARNECRRHEGGEHERGCPPLVRGVRVISPGKIWFSKASEKQFEVFLWSFLSRNSEENIVIFYILTFYFCTFLTFNFCTFIG